MNEISPNFSLLETDFVSLREHMVAPVVDDGIELLRQSGLFDEAWYAKRNPDVVAGRLEPLHHFLLQGWQEGRNPNPYFDIDYYLAENPDVRAAGINPLLHYILAGEACGRAPSAVFDTAWYASHHSVPPGISALAHFLSLRTGGTASPIPEFDAAYYLANNKDIAAAGIDPFDHFLRYGYREGRDPSAEFDVKFYLHRYLGGEMDQNPLLHWRQWRHALRLHTTAPAHESSVFEQVRQFSRPGPDFEEIQPLPRGARRQAKLLAYYLPQFHAVEENDTWWGRGFTEWTAISRGMPRFAGHYQPRIPRDLGHYDLADPATMRRQIAMARDAGVFGFVHYFYWFNGRRLLDRPTEAMISDPSMDFPFCLMWANENWTRRWDGSDQEVLISQDYREQDDDALLACFARHFADPRYIRLSGRPLLMVYRAGLIPHTPDTIARWREMFRDRHGEDPIFVMAQSFDNIDPVEYGFDGAIEFPPHKLTKGLRTRNAEHRCFDPKARGQIYAYDDVVAASLAEPAPAYPLIKTAMPSWDNDARREGMGMALIGSTPAKYQAWLTELVDRSAEQDFHGERIVCVNAWNEWAEGAYLEPDVYFGGAYLNATGRAVARLADAGACERLLLVGHDAFAAGAQMLLLNLGRQLMAAHGAAVEFLLLGDGALAPDYSALAPTQIAKTRKALGEQIAAAVRRGVTRALVNTSAAARVIPLLKRAGIESVLLVHEMPKVIAAQSLLAGARDGAAQALRVIFPAICVAEAFPAADVLGESQSRILPQGLYRQISFDASARQRVRAQLGMAPDAALVIGSGYGDMRKGFDLFLAAARIIRRQNAPVHFCWVGAVDPSLTGHLAAEILALQASGFGHFPGFQQDMASWMSAADAFALTSREDPFPSVALEAMATGLGVAAFAGSGGISALLEEESLGVVVPLSDCGALAHALLALVGQRDPAVRAKRAREATARFDFAAYTADLLAELRTDAPRISVAVLSHNYARYLPERLASVFSQSCPVEEVIVLDDASTDDSAAVAVATAKDWRRVIRLEANGINSGGVFRQWQRAADLARGSHLWIAEADDAAHPELLARLSRLVAEHPEMDIAFCDSRAVDSAGETVMADYKAYYRSSTSEDLARDGMFAAEDFMRDCMGERNLILNASAVVFRTEALRAALARCAAEMPDWRVAGDWRLYVDILAHSAGRVGYLAMPLNVHRRHSASATAQLSKPGMLDEITRMHAVVNALLPQDPARLARQARYRSSLEVVAV